MAQRIVHQSLTIASGTTTDSFEVTDAICGVYFPASMSSTSFSFQSSPDNVTFSQVDANGAILSKTMTSSRYVSLTSVAELAGCKYLKIVMGSSETAKTIIVALRDIS